MGALFSYGTNNAPTGDAGRRKGMPAEVNLLFRLPNDLFVRILSEWLVIRDVGRLDAAMTNEKNRQEFLQCLSQMRNLTVPRSFEGKHKHDVTLLTWISKRQIHVETLSLLDFGKDDIIEGLHLPSLRKLIAGKLHESPPWLRHIPHLSPLLEELSVVVIHSRPVMEDLSYVLSQCRHLKNVFVDTMWFHINFTEDVLEGLKPYGHLIVEIRSFNGNSSTVTTAGFLKHCSRLKKLDYSRFVDNGTLLMCVAQSCPLLEDITFDTFSTHALLALTVNCKRLRKIHCKCYVPELPDLTASAIKVLKQMDTLEELSLTGCCQTKSLP